MTELTDISKTYSDILKTNCNLNRPDKLQPCRLAQTWSRFTLKEACATKATSAGHELFSEIELRTMDSDIPHLCTTKTSVSE